MVGKEGAIGSTCFKCGRRATDNVKLFRFPKPGSYNLVKTQKWANYVFPDKHNTIDVQLKLYNQNRMLCQEHFKDEDFVADVQYLARYAVPCDVLRVNENIVQPPSTPVIKSEPDAPQNMPPMENENIVQPPSTPVIKSEPDAPQNMPPMEIAEVREQVASDSPSTSGCSTARKRPGEFIEETESVCSKKGSGDKLLSSILDQHMDMMNRILATQREQNEKIETLISTNNPGLIESLYLAPDSTQIKIEDGQPCEDSQPCPSSRLTSEAFENLAREADATQKQRDLQKSVLRDIISSAQREIDALTSGPDDLYDFSPSTEAEPEVSTPHPFFLKQFFLKQGVHCQRFGQEGWRNLRYGDRNQFEASPAFCALKVNNLLAGVTPNCKSTASAVLENFDLTLGAITHGLLQQRKIFRDTFNLLPPDVKGTLEKDFISPDSTFKKKSDALLQYVCGRRAEVIEQRRDEFKVPNKALNKILHSIPPSETHLFADDTLSKAV